MRSDIITVIKLLHDEMRQITIDAGVRLETYESVIAFEDQIQDVELEALLAWLQFVFEGPYRDVVKVWQCHPKSRWNYYYNLGMGLTEIRILNTARRKLHETWKKPYYPDGHKRRTEKVSVQSKCDGTNGSLD